MEISVLILSCVILGLNPVLPVLHIYIYIYIYIHIYIFNFTICNVIWILPKKKKKPYTREMVNNEASWPPGPATDMLNKLSGRGNYYSLYRLDLLIHCK